MKNNLIAILGLLTVVLSSCSGARIATMRQSKMEQLELGMSKLQVVNILGSSYSIAQKEANAMDTIEVISYRNVPFDEEYYLFRFKNNKLEKWHREFQPIYKEIKP
ncbi:MAG: hypothetical protein K0S24_3577 [Sphingobacterium sp.]|nr:hypothetical protein [Sphingobacterium sp.]